MTGYFLQAFIYLCAAVIAVPLAKRMGLGSVLGYLIAGVIIGPIIGLVGQETAAIQHFAEFGVVMMLFLVGMELEPRMLWEMKARLLGLGGAQVAITTGLITFIAMQLGQVWSVGLAVGLIFALSSTAIVLQTFQEKKLAKTEGGRSAFSVLLFQDIAVIPMLALIPLLALPELIDLSASGSTASGHHEELSLVANLPGWAHAAVVVAAVVGVIAGGHYLAHPLFRYVVESGLREVFTATALMLVIGIAALMSLVGLSPALGAFLAGVVLANSEFRHELESNIEPFKGLLLGLFFITVGAGIRFDLLAQYAGVILALTLAVMLIKAVVLYILALIFRVKGSNRWLLTLSLAQAGEFGFVLLGYSQQHHVLPTELAQILSMVVAISMFLTPGLFIFFDKVIVPKLSQKTNKQQVPDEIDEQGSAIIAGIGRFGQIVNRMLTANGFKTVVLDHDMSQVDNVRRVNIKSFFGDSTQPDLLHTAGIEHSSLIVVAIDDKQRATDLVHYVKHTYPHVHILARAFDRGHGYELKRAGADWIVSETYHSAMEMGGEALKAMGLHPFRVEQMKTAMLEREQVHEAELYDVWQKIDEDVKFSYQYTQLFIKLEEAMSDAMKKDRADYHTRSQHGWVPPPKNYIDEIEQDLKNDPC
ncbi:monovalent cation:proton antiporter-2 (CPA2) family protein [Oceanospirillum beijerinckii]|uniref:monovalent cation:proton antiporter-2 (CPA2) family protein n=1 Tax=Oceanospirillum beijerinckii TaxID=64976 RepID=UPI00040B34A0|nr:monovalent cation:proton antiporter-2 (CPA2) family protein [Oceanospirillum beijerinckii]